MFIGVYKLENTEHFNLYNDNINGWNAWHSETFSPEVKDIKILKFKIHGKNYQEQKASARDLAIEYQTQFTDYNWSYYELMEFGGYFYELGKRYGLLKEFRENGII